MHELPCTDDDEQPRVPLVHISNEAECFVWTTLCLRWASNFERNDEINKRTVTCLECLAYASTNDMHRSPRLLEA